MENSRTHILVTGINGFVGPHLAKELKSRGAAVIGLGHGEASAELQTDLEQYLSLDLTDEAAVRDTLDFSNIRAVIHLAGLSSQGMSFEQPQKFISLNSAMLIHLFEAALQQHQTPRFVVVSTGAVYDANQPMPLNETSAVTFNSPYAVSKILNENLCAYYQKRGFETVTVRPFNHTGPGQGPGFLIPDLVQQVLAAGKDGTLKIGNLQTRRDYSDARDIVRAYAELALAESVPHPLYNLSSGQSRSGEEILMEIIKAVHGEEVAIKTETDPAKIRPNDPPEIYGDNSRMQQDFGWEPQITLAKTIGDYVAWYKGTR